MDTRKIEDVPFEEVHEIQRYGTYFSEKSFWKKIERVAKKVGLRYCVLSSRCIICCRMKRYLFNIRLI